MGKRRNRADLESGAFSPLFAGDLSASLWLAPGNVLSPDFVPRLCLTDSRRTPDLCRPCIASRFSCPPCSCHFCHAGNHLPAVLNRKLKAGKWWQENSDPAFCHFLAVHLPASPSSYRHPACLAVVGLRLTCWS